MRGADRKAGLRSEAIVPSAGTYHTRRGGVNSPDVICGLSSRGG